MSMDTLINRVHCMDALDFLRLIPDSGVDLVLTDIPYAEINHIDRLHEREKYKGGGIRKLHKGIADVMRIDLIELCTQINRVARGFIYIFCGSYQLGVMRQYFDNADCMTRVGVWEKTNPSPLHAQYLWLSSIELCLIVRKRNAVFNEFCESPVWHYPSGTSDLHPTTKPIPLFQRLIEASSQPDDIVLDPFCGVGTTGIAARNCNRRYALCDNSQKHCAIAEDRLRLPFEPRSTTSENDLSGLPLFEGLA